MGEMVGQLGRPFADRALTGLNSTLISYGERMAGKTFVLDGCPSASPSGLPSAGVASAVVRELFAMVSDAHQRNVTRFSVTVTCVELKGDLIRDLFSTSSGPSAPKHDIRRDPEGHMFVSDLTYVQINSADDYERLRRILQSRRSTHSWRTQCVITILVDGTHLPSGRPLPTGRITFVDLAASQRPLRGDPLSDSAREQQRIAKSLGTLGDVLTAIACRHAYIPYRQSRLTMLLHDALACESQVVLVANVFVDEQHAPETLNTLLFGARIKAAPEAAPPGSSPRDRTWRAASSSLRSPPVTPGTSSEPLQAYLPLSPRR
eukprot:GAFH01003051.1.p1 GENE.GAFH01003051.1~~GAFH01003051.1.p1  ORF type:complete len:319 (-),score=44.34 GAFH01003051.1:59-1015(-)